MTEPGLSGPPEPVVTDDGDVRIIQPRDDYNPVDDPSPIRAIKPGTWICTRCNTETYAGVKNGEVQEPHECSGCERQGPFDHAGGLGEDTIQTALKAGEMWDPPAGISGDGYEDLWHDVENYLWDHWDASEADIYTGLTAYALSTWVRENLTFVPHLMLMGQTTGGKTRLLNTLKRVSYRAMVAASATPASMFRLIDGYDVTYYISEYHGLGSKARKQLDNVVRAGQKRGEKVTRAEQTSSGYEPDVYDPFTHVAIATQFTPDDDIVNRCIQIRSESNNREMPATHDEETAREVRKRLLFARYRLLNSDEWEDAEERAYAYLKDKGIEGRTREKLLSLVTVAYLWGRVDAIGPFVERVVEQDREATADSEDALVVKAIRDAADERKAETTVLGSDPYSAVKIPYKTDDDDDFDGIANRYQDMTGVEKKPSWVGHVVKRLGLEKERTRDGTVISDPDLGPKLRELCEDLNLEWNGEEDTSQADAIRQVHNTVARLESESDAGYAARDAVKDELREEIGDRDPDHLIENALESGELYEPQENHLATT